MNPNQRHPSPGGAGMTQTFPMVQSGLEFQYGRMPGFQQMQGKPINIQGMVGSTVNTYNYISNFTGILPQGQGSVMTGVPQGHSAMMTTGQSSMGMMAGVPQSQSAMMTSMHQGQGHLMASIQQGQGHILPGMSQGQGSVVVPQQVQGSVITEAHQPGQGQILASGNQQQQGQGSLIGIPQGQGSVITNMQGGMPLNNYITATSTGGGLPSMGSFVASFNHPNFNMGQYMVHNNKGGMENWVHQQQGGNALPSFGHFLMPQQFQQQHSPRQQQPQLQQQIQHFFPGNQGQGRFSGAMNPMIQQGGIGQMFPVSSSVSNVMNPGQTFSNMNMNNNMNTGVLTHSTAGQNQNIGLDAIFQSPHPSNLNPVLSQSHCVTQISQIPGSCNQITNTTSSVITTTSSRSAAPVTANVHIKTSVTPAVVPSSVSVSVHDNVVNSSTNSINVSHEMDNNVVTMDHTVTMETGCDSKSEISQTSDVQSSGDVNPTDARNLSQVGGEQLPTQTVIVPLGWRRVHEDSSIVYYSPSNNRLGSLQEIRHYLSTEGTCKCGLECPLVVNKIFNFDPCVQSRQWSLDVHCAEDLTKLCNHKRKIIAMATFQSSKSFPMVTTTSPSISGMVGSAILSTSITSVAGQINKNRKETKSKKKKSKVQQSPYDGLLVSQLLAQRDRLKSNQCKTGRITPGQLKVENPGIQDTPLSPGSKGQNVTGHQLNSLPSPAASDSGSQGRSSVKDPADDLGPISSGKPIKLDFSRGIGPLDGLQRMNVNPQAMSSNTAPMKTGNQLMQQNPLTVQTAFPQEQFKDQMYIQQSPHTPSGHSPAFTFPQNQVNQCANFGVGVPMGTAVNMQQNPGFVVHGTHQGNFPFYQIQNPPPGHYIGQNMMTGHPFHRMSQGMPGPYHMGQQQGMFHPPNAILQSMGEMGWQEPKKRQRKPRAKKEKKKVNNVFESDTPPPNVDVSQLQDHGRGPIPKVKKSPTSSSSSFLENPTAFLAEQTALISNSLTSTLSSPKATTLSNPSENTKNSDDSKNADTVDGDIDTSKTKLPSTESVSNTLTSTTPSESANRCSSTNSCSTSFSVTGTSSSDPPIGMSVSSISAVGSSSDWRSSTSSSESLTTPHLSDNPADMFTEDRCESLSPESGDSECPALNETITPSSVVHHTATGETDDKMKPETAKSHSDKNILPSKNLPVSRIQSNIQQSITSSGASDIGSQGKTGLHSVQVSQTEHTLGMAAHRCNRNVGGLNPIQQMLGSQITNEFPASNLLSAAARAQMVQQQQMGLYMGQPPDGIQVSQSFPVNMNSGIGTGGLNVPQGFEFSSKSTQNNKGLHILSSEDGQIMISQQGFPVGNNAGISVQDSSRIMSVVSPPAKITSPVNTVGSTSTQGLGVVNSTSQDALSKMVVQPVNGILKSNQIDPMALKQGLSTFINQTMGHVDQTNLNEIPGQIVGSVNTPMPPISLPLVTGVTNSLTQVIPVVSGSQQQSVINMFNNMGVNAFQNGSMMLGQIPTAMSQEGLNSLPLINGTMSSLPLINGTVPTAYLNNNNIQGNFPRFMACSNGMVNIDSQAGTSGPMVDLGFATKQGQLGQMITGDGSGCLQLKTSQPIDVSHLNNKMSVQCEDQMIQPTFMFPNLQMPLLQVLGADQVPINQNFDKTNLHQFSLPNTGDLQHLINQLQSGQTPVGAPLNLMNVQQVWNNLTTGNNLTAMQLQTLQLQQQLLQQIQQLQGMQTLISQFNVQGNPSSTLTTVANKDGNNMTSSGQLTFTVTTNSSAVNSESKTSFSTATESDAVAMGTMVNDVSTTSDLYSQDRMEEEEEEGSLEGDDNYVTETENTIGLMSDSEVKGHSASTETEVLSSSSQIVSSSALSDKTVTTTDNERDDGNHGNELTTSDKVTSSNDPMSSNVKVYGSVESARAENGDNNLQANCNSQQVLGNNFVHVQAEALNLCTSSAASMVSDGESANNSSGVESSAKLRSKCVQICENTEGRKETRNDEKKDVDKSICKSNLMQQGNCDINPVTLSSSYDDKIPRCSVISTKEGHTQVSSSTSNSFKCSLSSTSGSFYASQSRVKSSPEHRSSVAEKPVEATLPSDIITTKSMDIRNCGGVQLYQASHMVQSVELSIETAEKAADALTIVSKTAKRPRELDMEDYPDEEPDDSTEEDCFSSFPRCFSIGDLVWGQIRGFPSWPGKVVHETEVIEGHEPECGKCWVKWFGDHTFTEVEPEKLKSLSEGLEAHHRARKKHRKGRKMNSNLEAAIHEAMIELDRQTALNLENKTHSKLSVHRGKLHNKKKRTR